MHQFSVKLLSHSCMKTNFSNLTIQIILSPARTASCWIWGPELELIMLRKVADLRGGRLSVISLHVKTGQETGCYIWHAADVETMACEMVVLKQWSE